MYDGDVAAAFGLAPLDATKAKGNAGIVDQVEDEERDWREDAACHPRHKPETMTIAAWVAPFFPARGESTSHVLAEFCDRCPVSDDCLNAANTVPAERQGIWGGQSERQRRRSGRSLSLGPHRPRVDQVPHGPH